MRPAGIVFARRHVRHDFTPVGTFVADVGGSWVARWSSALVTAPAREYVTGYLTDAERRVGEKAVDWTEAIQRITKTAAVGYLVWIEPVLVADDLDVAALYDHYVAGRAFLTPDQRVEPLESFLPFG